MRRARVVGAVLLLAALAGCTRDGAGSGAARVSVLGASSLTAAFDDLARRFERAHPDVRVERSFAGSPALVAQLRAGARADVVATADEPTMLRLARAGLVAEPRTFASNRLAVVVRAGNPKRIESLADLGRPGVVFVVCAPEVPCGRLARLALGRAGVSAVPASLEHNVKAVVGKVLLGEVDAGVVYETDAVEVAGRVEQVTVPPHANVTTRYPIARVVRGDGDAAERWIAFVLSGEGQSVLRRHGFGAP